MKRIIIYHGSSSQSPKILQKKRILLRNYDQKSMTWMEKTDLPNHLGKFERAFSRLKISMPSFQTRGKSLPFQRITCHFERLWSIVPSLFDEEREKEYQYVEFDTQESLVIMKTKRRDSEPLYNYHADLQRMKAQFDHSFSKFKKTMRSSHSLKELNLSCAWDNIIDNSYMSKLCRNFMYHPLKILRLRFCGKRDLNDVGMRKLSQTLKRIPSLRILYLNFKERSEITDEGVLSLGKCFTELASLEEIVLNFNGCGKITDKGLSDLLKNLNSCSFLEKLFLNFMGCHKLTDNGLLEIGKLLQQSPKQFGLTIGSEDKNQISAEGIAKLFKGQTLPINLEQICLGLRNIENAGETLPSIRHFLEPASKLQHINMTFRECSGVTREDEAAMNDFLESKISLKIVTLDLLPSDVQLEMTQLLQSLTCRDDAFERGGGDAFSEEEPEMIPTNQLTQSGKPNELRMKTEAPKSSGLGRMWKSIVSRFSSKTPEGKK